MPPSPTPSRRTALSSTTSTCSRCFTSARRSSRQRWRWPNANRRSGADLITAVVAGCEMMARASAATNPSLRDRGYHTTPVCGVFGAAVAAARLLKLDRDGDRVRARHGRRPGIRPDGDVRAIDAQAIQSGAGRAQRGHRGADGAVGIYRRGDHFRGRTRLLPGVQRSGRSRRAHQGSGQRLSGPHGIQAVFVRAADSQRDRLRARHPQGARSSRCRASSPSPSIVIRPGRTITRTPTRRRITRHR